MGRDWDLDEILWDSHGNLNVLGRLATDRPVVAKFYGAYNFTVGTQIGVSVYAGSGTPISTYVNTLNQIPVFVNGRGDMGRTPVCRTRIFWSLTSSALGGTRRFGSS